MFCPNSLPQFCGRNVTAIGSVRIEYSDKGKRLPGRQVLAASPESDELSMTELSRTSVVVVGLVDLCIGE